MSQDWEQQGFTSVQERLDQLARVYGEKLVKEACLRYANIEFIGSRETIRRNGVPTTRFGRWIGEEPVYAEGQNLGAEYARKMFEPVTLSPEDEDKVADLLDLEREGD